MLSVVNILFVQSVLGFNCEGGGGCLKLSKDMLRPENKNQGSLQKEKPMTEDPKIAF